MDGKVGHETVFLLSSSSVANLDCAGTVLTLEQNQTSSTELEIRNWSPTLTRPELELEQRLGLLLLLLL
jgi:hypothetical protein